MSGSVGRLGVPDVRSVTRWIYALVDPATARVYYVGRSANPKSRFAWHCSRGSLPVLAWVRSLGRRPCLALLATVAPGEDADAAEREWIVRLAEEGHPLLNYAGLRSELRIRIGQELRQQDWYRALAVYSCSRCGGAGHNVTTCSRKRERSAEGHARPEAVHAGSGSQLSECSGGAGR